MCFEREDNRGFWCCMAIHHWLCGLKGLCEGYMLCICFSRDHGNLVSVLSIRKNYCQLLVMIVVIMVSVFMVPYLWEPQFIYLINFNKCRFYSPLILTHPVLWVALPPSTHHSRHRSPPHSFIPGLKPFFSALTARIAQTVYCYIWAYPVLLFSFSFFSIF